MGCDERLFAQKKSTGVVQKVDALKDAFFRVMPVQGNIKSTGVPLLLNDPATGRTVGTGHLEWVLSMPVASRMNASVLESSDRNNHLWDIAQDTPVG